ncbi:MAG: GNAT family N-acetyltransferase [Dehalococcoidia bacterium]
MTLDVRIVRSEDLSHDQREGLVSLCSAAFGLDMRMLTSMSHSLHVIGYLDGAPVSHASRITRWLQPGTPRPLRTAYVESVVTMRGCQGRGYATTVMRRLQEEVQDYELGVLSTGKPGFYARLGWAPWRGPLAVREVHDGSALAKTTDSIMVLCLPKTPSLNLDSLMTVEWRPGEIW